MPILANRTKKSRIFESGSIIAYAFRHILLAFLTILCCYYISFSAPPLLTKILLECTGQIVSTSNSVYSSITDTALSIYNQLIYLRNLEEENLQLKLRLRSLLHNQEQEVMLKRENQSFREILQVVDEMPSKFVTAKVISVSISPFAKSIILNCGTNHGVKVNDIVRGKRSLLGRVSAVSANFATVMLINDYNSRIPVYCRCNRGILAQHEDHLKIMYLRENHDIKVGDKIFTSGDGKIFPRDIPVATVTSVHGNEIIVHSPNELENFDFVTVESVVREL